MRGREPPRGGRARAWARQGGPAKRGRGERPPPDSTGPTWGKRGTKNHDAQSITPKIKNICSAAGSANSSAHNWVKAGCQRTSERQRASEQASKTLVLAISATHHLFPRSNSSLISPMGLYQIVHCRFVGISHTRGLSRKGYTQD